MLGAKIFTLSCLRLVEWFFRVEGIGGGASGERGEKTGGEQQPQHQRKLSEERKMIINQATDFLSNWKNVVNVAEQRLYIDSGSASDAMWPLYEAAMTITDDQFEKNNSSSNTPMQAFFNEQKNYHAAKQEEIKKNKDN